MKFTCIFAMMAFFPFCLIARDVIPADESYRDKIVEAVKEGNIGWIADEINYPILVSQENEKIVIQDREAFMKVLSDRLNPSLRKEILSEAKQPLFANWKGLMIGSGHVWFEQIKDNESASWDYRILAFGLFAFQPPYEIEGE
ncbi:hypothetical protein [Coraliomargarita parva]|uniref:hypothetical protein n=1 Tax=Coraliomargarita parva TaxID=3014050 RepID=UPI0022B5B9F8|nr:hypothetical protein [Coraliomargarita parva]